jgi:hypothetical protein
VWRNFLSSACSEINWRYPTWDKSFIVGLFSYRVGSKHCIFSSLYTLTPQWILKVIFKKIFQDDLLSSLRVYLFGPQLTWRSTSKCRLPNCHHQNVNINFWFILTLPDLGNLLGYHLALAVGTYVAPAGGPPGWAKNVDIVHFFRHFESRHCNVAPSWRHTRFLF